MEELSLTEEARLYLHARILRCPFGDNPPDCPLYAIRKLPVSGRIAWLNSQSDEEVLELYGTHNKCFDVKLAKVSA